MKATARTQAELIAMNRQELIAILKSEFKSTEPLSRAQKPDLVVWILDAQLKLKAGKKKVSVEIVTEDKVNKSDLLRKEIRRRARAQETLNSGELIKFMDTTHEIKMSRQFIVNVRNRFLKVCPELLKA